MTTNPGTFCPAIVTMNSGNPRLTITSGSNTGATKVSCGATVALCSQPVPAETTITIVATTMAPGTAERGPQAAQHDEHRADEERPHRGREVGVVVACRNQQRGPGCRPGEGDRHPV